MSYRRQETILNFAAHPMLWGLAKTARRMGPFWRLPGLGVVVSDASCAREILSRDGDFTKNGPGSFASVITQGLGAMALGNMDGDDHRRIRDALASVLAPARAEEIMRRRSADLKPVCTQLASGGAVDIVHFTRGWAGRIAFDVIGAEPTAGQEEAESLDLVRVSERLSETLGFRKPSSRSLRNAASDRAKLADLFCDAYGSPAPEHSLIARLQELNLDFDSALGLLSIYAIGGTLTLSAALPRIIALLIDSGEYSQLVQKPGLISQAVDEGLRYTTPLPGTIRIVRKDVEIGGYLLAADTRLIILTCNMARDPQYFVDADRFNIARKYNSRAGRLWYGAGAHRCVGFSLAQRELKEALGVLTANIPALRIVSRRVTFGALLPAYRELILESASPAH